MDIFILIAGTFLYFYRRIIFLSQRPYQLTKHQHASLDCIVDVVLLLWVATKIVMSCLHLIVISSTGPPVCRSELHKKYNIPLI